MKGFFGVTQRQPGTCLLKLPQAENIENTAAPFFRFLVSRIGKTEK